MEEAYLVGKMKSHGPRSSKGTNAKREQLSSQEVLHRVPAKSPAESGDVDHGNSATASSLLVSRKNEVIFNSKLGHGSEEAGDVDHGQGLEGDTGKQGTLAANDVDQEERASNGANELDDTEDGGNEETLRATFDTDESEQVGGIESDGASTRPLRQELDHAGHVETVQVALVEEHFLQLAHKANTLSSLKLVVQSDLDLVDVVDDVFARRVLLAKLGENHGGLLNLALLHQVTRGLELEKGQDKGDASEHDVQAGGDEPLVVAAVADVEGGTVVGEVGEDDSDVNGTGEETGTETTDGSRGDLGEVDRSNNGRHADTKTTDEATSVDTTKISVDTGDHEDGNTNGPNRSQNTGSPDTSDAITDHECTVSKILALDRCGKSDKQLTQEHHRRNRSEP